MTPSRIMFVLCIPALIAGCGQGCNRGGGGSSGGAGAPRAAERPRAPVTTVAPPAIPGPYQLQRPIGWTVGDVISSTGRIRTTGRVVQVSPDGRRTPTLDIADNVQAAWSEKVLEVDGEGHRSRSLVTLDKWFRRRGPARDASIEGASITVSGDGKARSWAFVAHKGEPSAEAKNWLDERFGARGLSDEQWLRVMLPDERVPAGRTFHPDLDRLAAAMEETGLAVDRSRLSASVTLQAVEGRTARCAFKAEAALLRVPNSGVAWTRGGTLTFEGTMAVPIEPAPLVLADLDRTARLSGETSENDAVLQYDFVTHEWRTTTWGGTLPDGATER